MKRPLLDSCCRCGSLRTGTIITGVLLMLLSVATICIIFLTRYKFKTFLIQDLDPFIVKIILTINLVMTILISLFLIIGALKRNTFMMLPWIVLGIIVVIGLFFSIIYSSICSFIDGKNTEGAVMLVVGLIWTAISLYLWCVVLSFYQVVTDEKARGPYQRPPYQHYKH